MLLVRVAGFLAALVMAGGIVLWMLTGNRRYLRLAQWVPVPVVFVLIVLALMFLERLILTDAPHAQGRFRQCMRLVLD